MPPPRRVLATVIAGAVLGAVASAAPASAAGVTVGVGCVVFGDDYSEPAIPISGTGFTPNSAVTLSTTSKKEPSPKPLGTVTANGAGNFGTITGAAEFNDKQKTRNQMFDLIASDGVNSAITTFRQVRAGYNRSPEPKRPGQRVTHIARGFTPGKTVWTHFRHDGKTRADKRLGVAQGPCGIVTRKMRALPAQSRLGSWRVYVDEQKTFSASPLGTQVLLRFRVCAGPLS